MIAKTYSSTVYGVEAQIISIEVNIVNGTKFFIVGLPDNAIKESAYRIESVLKQIDKRMPRRRLIVNLAPASLRTEGAAYDLPIALSILQASNQATLENLQEYIIMGELALDGHLRPVCGVLPIAIEARKRNFKGFILPKANANEAAIVEGIPIIPLTHITEAIAFLSGQKDIPPVTVDTRSIFQHSANVYDLDFADVRGQLMPKRSVEIAAAGGHNLLMIGPPGAGKTMLAKRIPSILPPLTLEEALETSKVYSVLGQLVGREAIITKRPFRAPHHTISDVALVGGGSIPQPGQISLAHNGVLYLDELAEFKRSTIEVLRQPLEDKTIQITRAKISLGFPANFMLISSMNPCPCGYYTHPKKACSCSPFMRKKYINKISGPLLDRIDIHIQVNPVSLEAIASLPPTTNSATIRAKVAKARQIQQKRFLHFPHIHNNSMMSSKLIQTLCPLPKATYQLLKDVMEKFNLSARAYNSICKLARTIADLAESAQIQESHVAEAVAYRSLDQEKWGE